MPGESPVSHQSSPSVITPGSCRTASSHGSPPKTDESRVARCLERAGQGCRVRDIVGGVNGIGSQRVVHYIHPASSRLAPAGVSLNYPLQALHRATGSRLLLSRQRQDYQLVNTSQFSRPGSLDRKLGTVGPPILSKTLLKY